MKVGTLLLITSIFCSPLLLPLPASAQSDDMTMWADRLIVIDKDPKGANMRDAPSGKILRALPQATAANPQLVSVHEASKGWFRATVNGAEGWMHGTVLGTCSGASEEGEPRLNKTASDDGGYVSPKIPYGTRLTPLDIKGQWLKVRYVDAKGKKYEGWIMNHVLAFPNELQNDCAVAWDKRK